MATESIVASFRLTRAASLKEYATASAQKSSVRRSRTMPGNTRKFREEGGNDDNCVKEEQCANDTTDTTLLSSDSVVAHGHGDDVRNGINYSDGRDNHVDGGFVTDNVALNGDSNLLCADADIRCNDHVAHAPDNASAMNSNDYETINTEGSDFGDDTDGCDFSRALDTSNDDCCKYRSSDIRKKQEDDITPNDIFSDDASAAPSEANSEASLIVLMRYMGLTSKPYMAKPKEPKVDVPFTHDLQEGDHVIRWKMLGYCYPIQVHGIVFSVGPDVVTIVDCGLASYNNLDKVGTFEEEDPNNAKKTRRRMNILTLIEEKEINKWTRIRYGEEVELKVHSSNEEMQQNVNAEQLLHDYAKESRSASANNIEESQSAGLELEEVEKCVEAKIKTTPEKRSPKSSKKSPSSSWFWSCQSPDNTIEADAASKPVSKPSSPKQNSQKLRLPKTDPTMLVLARLRFLLEYGEQAWPPPASADSNDNVKDEQYRPNLLPSPHLLYANSECIAVFCKTGRWSTLQAAIFLHSSTVGNVKQTATVAMFLSSQTVTVPASGFWGLFGGTTTVSLFTAQPWLVPALVGGGMVYVGLPMLMLWKAKGRWGDTERSLNAAFWSISHAGVTDEMIRCWSGEELTVR